MKHEEGMTKFEEFLLESGYVRRNADGSEPKKYLYSTMGDICYMYVNETLDRKVYFGLHEHKRPPTIIWPRPRIVGRDDKGCLVFEDRDDSVNKVLGIYPPSEILRAIFDKEAILTF